MIGAPLVEEGLQVVRMNRGFQIPLQPLIVINEHKHKMFEAPFSKESYNASFKQTNDIVMPKPLLQKFRNAELGTIFLQGDRVGSGTNVK